MKPIDIIIISALVVVLSLIVYFAIWKKKDDPCKGCPYAKRCESKECKKKK